MLSGVLNLWHELPLSVLSRQISGFLHFNLGSSGLGCWFGLVSSNTMGPANIPEMHQEGGNWLKEIQRKVRFGLLSGLGGVCREQGLSRSLTCLGPEPVAGR